MYPPLDVGVAGGGYDPPWAFRQPGKEEPGQQERGEIVGLEGALEAVSGELGDLVHAARAVGQHVDAVIRGEKLVSETAHVVEFLEVGHVADAADLVCDCLCALRVTAGDDDRRSVLGQVGGSCFADAAGAGSDEDPEIQTCPCS